MNLLTNIFTKKRSLFLLVIILISSLFAFSVAFSQFRGESELQTLKASESLYNDIKILNIIDFCKVLIGAYHPPARYIITLPFIAIFGSNEFSLRLPNIIFWIATSILAFFIGEILLDIWCGFFSGLLIGSAGFFGIEAIGSTHGYLTFWIMMLIYHILKNPSFLLQTNYDIKNFLIGNIFLAIGFLGFTSIIPIIFTYNAIYLYYSIKKNPKTIKQYILNLTPFALFYIIYYLFFLGIPYYFYINGTLDNYIGQLFQNVYRKSSSYLNILSLISNLKGINSYFFPFLSWIILIIGIIFLIKYNKHIFLIITGYALLFSFYIYGNTSNHFLSFFIWIIPMSAAFIITYLKKYSNLIFIILTILIMAWSFVIHVKRYTEKKYPYYLLKYTFSDTFRINNITRPVKEISNDLKYYVKQDEKYLNLADGAIKYYAKGVNYCDKSSEIYLYDNKCFKFHNKNSLEYIRAAVINEKDIFCDDIIEKKIDYENSYLKIIIFKNPKKL